MPTYKRPSNDKVDPVQLADHLEKHHQFVVDTKLTADALSYELPGHSLKHYLHLLSPVRPGESFGDDEWRVMGRLWYGKRYHHGLVIEVFGEKLDAHMYKIARHLIEDFGHEVRVMIRTLRRARYV